MPDLNVVLNIATLLVLIGGVTIGVILGPRAFKAKQVEKDLAEKDRTIATHEQSIAAMTTAADIALQDREAMQRRCDDAVERAAKYQEIAAKFQGRYEEAQRYSAPEAFKTIERIITEQGKDNERRHVEVMRVLDGQNELLGERREAYRVDPDESTHAPS